MAHDIFLKIPEIEGEATDAGYEKQIACTSFSHGISIPTDHLKATGECQHQPISISKEIDAATPLLNQACCLGQNLGDLEIAALRAGGDHRVPYLTIKLSGAIVSSISASGMEGTLGAENLTLDYSKIEWIYKTHDGNQTGGSWNITKTTT